MARRKRHQCAKRLQAGVAAHVIPDLPEPAETASANGESAEPAKPEPPVVGLGIKPGARRPGKR